jgi:arabinose-5-phosphate isomerase
MTDQTAIAYKQQTPADAAEPCVEVLRVAARTLKIESEAVAAACSALDSSFAHAVQLIMACTGRVIVTGMGKSGHVGRKIAATLASTGTPSLFMHPAEASHGDLGMVTTRDVLLALSNSGESDELNVILPVIKRLGVPLVAITGGMRSSLAAQADAVINSAVAQEACPLNLAPTASTTVQMALGDALAVALLELRGFKPDDFARSHPGGALGRRLLVHVTDLMRRDDQLPLVRTDAPLILMLREMSRKGLGFVACLDDALHPRGIFTDGDLRRLIEAGANLQQLKASDVMRPHPRTIPADALAAQAATLMEEHQITSVLVVDQTGCVVGALNTNDLLRAKVI